MLQDDYEKIGKRSLADIKNDVQGRLWIQNAPGWSWLGNDFSGNEGGQSAVSALSRMLSMMGIGSRNQNIIIKGLDFNTMQLVGEDLKYYLSQMDFISNSGLSYAGSRPEVHVNPDQIMTNSYEITKNNISEGLSSLNKQNSSGSSFKTKDKEYDIVISEKMPEAVTPEQIGRAHV